MPKVIGCMNCGYRTENKAEIDLFIINGCNCQKETKQMCDLCGKSKGFFTRPYRYDNGEAFLAKVCQKCADLHHKLTKGAK